MHDAILAINTGSSSIKFALYRCELKNKLLQLYDHGIIDLKNIFGNNFKEKFTQAFQDIFTRLTKSYGDYNILATTHRVVHGGTFFKEAVVVDNNVMQQLQQLNTLAPLHQPYNLLGIELCQQQWPSAVTIACFDTAFHMTQPQLAQLFAIPYEDYTQGVRRYGFHGLSYQYIVSKLPQALPECAQGKIIIAHLGSGASVCAVSAGKSVATSMGFSALDGLPMATRCGALDAGVVLYYLQTLHKTPEEVSDLLYKHSGLLGISGESADVRDLHASKSVRAQLALHYFAYAIAREMAALLPALQGLDALIFTAGIGEHDAWLRAAVCAQLQWLGVELDENVNQTSAVCISAATSAIKVCVIPTNEEQMMVMQALTCL